MTRSEPGAGAQTRDHAEGDADHRGDERREGHDREGHRDLDRELRADRLEVAPGDAEVEQRGMRQPVPELHQERTVEADLLGQRRLLRRTRRRTEERCGRVADGEVRQEEGADRDRDEQEDAGQHPLRREHKHGNLSGVEGSEGEDAGAAEVAAAPAGVSPG